MGREDKYDLRLAYPTTPAYPAIKTLDSVTPQHETNEHSHQCFPQITSRNWKIVFIISRGY
jgi:hypothetical protein